MFKAIVSLLYTRHSDAPVYRARLYVESYLKFTALWTLMLLVSNMLKSVTVTAAAVVVVVIARGSGEVRLLVHLHVGHVGRPFPPLPCPRRPIGPLFRIRVEDDMVHPGPLRAPVKVLAADVSPGSLRAKAEVRKDDLVLPGHRTAQTDGRTSTTVEGDGVGHEGPLMGPVVLDGP